MAHPCDVANYICVIIYCKSEILQATLSQLLLFKVLMVDHKVIALSIFKTFDLLETLVDFADNYHHLM